jgi:hypothetical protein
MQRKELEHLIRAAAAITNQYEFVIHDRFGYYAQGVGPNTAILPTDWQLRLVKIQNENTDLKIGLCLDPTDLAASKLAAGREKDWLFVNELLHHRFVKPEVLIARIETLNIDKQRRQALIQWVKARRPS